MHLLGSVAVALFSGAALAASVPSSHVLHEKRDIIPPQWVKRSRAPAGTKLPVRIAITPRNAELGHDMLMDISDPASKNYGKHWTPKQVADFFSPDRQTVSAVRLWLSQSGIHSTRHEVASSRGSIQFSAEISEIEELLGTQYDIWEHSETGAVTVSCDEYHVPQHIRHHIDFVTPTIGIDSPRAALPQKRSLNKRASSVKNPLKTPAPAFYKAVVKEGNVTNCDLAITPDCVKALYDVPEPPSPPQAGNELGIYECGDEYDQADFDDFFTQFAPNIPNGTHPLLQSIDGGEAPVPQDEGGGESTLDFELAYPLIYPQGIKLYQTLDDYSLETSGLGIWNPWLDALDASYCTYDGGDNKTIDPTFPDGHGYNQTEQCGAYTPTNVISLSYQLAEAFYPPNYEQRQCHEYMKLGLQGTSILFSSGDNGTLARAGVAGCLAGGTNNPGFPSTCPYVTSVGATQIKLGNTVDDPEEAVDPDNIYAFSSGGGFSNVFPIPDYQAEAVSTFLNGGVLPPAYTYNASGRAFPDVSANGWNISTYVDGEFFLNAGTSASAPIFSSIINRINEERIAAGKGPVGFLNPTMYANPDAFNDITTGYNLGCNAAVGFNATPGWDPVTGLGTPNYPKLLDVFMALP